jgi:hypothetical protein
VSCWLDAAGALIVITTSSFECGLRHQTVTGLMRPMKRLVPLMMLVATGCSTTYTPRPSARLHMAMSGGEVVLARDGEEYSLGLLGDVTGAVTGVPAAVDHADSYETLTIAGFVFGIIGAGASGAGAGVIIGASADLPPGQGISDTTIGVGLGLAFGGLALALVGAGFQIAAQPHLLDAVNIYNDSVDPGMAPPLYPVGPPVNLPAGPPPAAPPPAVPAPQQVPPQQVPTPEPAPAPTPPAPDVPETPQPEAPAPN